MPKFEILIVPRAHVLKKRVFTNDLHLGMWLRFYSQSDFVIYALIQSEI